MIKVLSISGRRESGKDTVGNFILRNHSEFNSPVCRLNQIIKYGIQKYNFADPLKKLVHDLFDVPMDVLYGPQELKDTFKTCVTWGNMPYATDLNNASPQVLLDEFGLKAKPVWTEQLTCRELLQQFGTNVMRRMYGDIWANKCLKTIKQDKPYLAIICDTRFPNEFDLFNSDKDIEFIGLRLTRFIKEDSHISEKALDDYVKEGKFHHIIDNLKMNIDDTNHLVLKILRGCRWF